MTSVGHMVCLPRGLESENNLHKDCQSPFFIFLFVFYLILLFNFNVHYFYYLFFLVLSIFL